MVGGQEAHGLWYAPEPAQMGAMKATASMQVYLLKIHREGDHAGSLIKCRPGLTVLGVTALTETLLCRQLAYV